MLFRSGDLLLDVAQELDVAWLQLARLNQIAPPYLLMPGTMLQIPQELVESEVEAPDTYTATRNESLIGVALYFGQDWVRMAEENHISFPYLIIAGETVLLP